MDSAAFGGGYGTHLPALAAAVSASTGAVLELGAGNCSTPVLHAMCAAKFRTLLTVDSDQTWLGRFQSLECSWHTLRHQPDWNIADLTETFWSVVLIDHAPEEQRHVDLARFSDCAFYLVVHDTNFVNYEAALSRFQYRTDYKRLSPHTAVVSNFGPLREDI